MKQNYLKVNYGARKQNAAYDQRLVEHLLKHISSLPSRGSVLDVACGTGAFRLVFRQLGFDYFGVDIDNHRPDLSISKIDIGSQRLPFADDTFDLAFFKMGIEHLSLVEITHCLSEIRRVLKPGGHTIILTPDWRWMYKIFYNEYTHQTPFTPDSLRTAMEMNGLNCVASKSLIQLPIVWQLPWTEFFCDLAQLFYPVWSRHKFVKYSKERIVFGLGRK